MPDQHHFDFPPDDPVRRTRRYPTLKTAGAGANPQFGAIILALETHTPPRRTPASGQTTGRLEVALTPSDAMKLIDLLQGALDDLWVDRKIDDEFRDQS